MPLLLWESGFLSFFILRSEKKLPLYAENSDPVLTRFRKRVSIVYGWSIKEIFSISSIQQSGGSVSSRGLSLSDWILVFPRQPLVGREESL